MKHHPGIHTVVIELVPHAKQRNPKIQCGDYEETIPGVWHVCASRLPNWRHSMLIWFHELVEMIAIVSRGIPEPVIQRFDGQYLGKHPGSQDEPGDDSEAPYRLEHSIASGLERTLAAHLKIDWKEYCAAVDSLWAKPSVKKKNRNRKSDRRTAR